MAKTSTTHLLIPGETSWEIWSSGPSGLQLSSPPETLALKPSDLEKLPAGDYILFFPVKSLTAIPLQVNTGDESLFTDLADTHAERLGFRSDPFAGQLTDIFPLFTNSETSTILSVVLRAPRTEDLPVKSPKAFDISARAFPVRGNAITLWRELGLWVFAIHQEGKLLYCQATSVSTPSPDASLIREIRIASAQLSMQGITSSPSAAIVWSSDPTTDTSLLSRSLSVQTELAPRPIPVLPEPLSKLLPADVRAARREAAKKRNITLVIAAIAVLYLGSVGYLGYQLWKTNSETRELLTEVNRIAPEGEAYAEHISRWDELEQALDLNYNTVDILSRVARSIPPNSGLRLTTADITSDTINIQGEAPQPQAVNQFSLNLTKNNDLAAFEWEIKAPRQSNRGWVFDFTGATATAAP